MNQIKTKLLIKTDKQTIVLIGAMGTGKSLLGLKLSNLLEKVFYDTDEELVKLTGTSINTIFDIEGEELFRERESKVLSSLLKLNDVIISTGGGIVLKKDNRIALKKAFVIYLQASSDCIYKRLKYDNVRPLLKKGNKKEMIEQILKQRVPLYESCADVFINVDNKKIDQILKEIKSKIKQ